MVTPDLNSLTRLAQSSVIHRGRPQKKQQDIIPEVQSVVDIVPESGTSQHIALTLALLAGEPVRTLAVLARIPIAVRVEVENRVVG